MSLINIVSEAYYSFDAFNSSVFCLASALPYNVSVECPVQNRSITCDGQVAGYVNFTCPAVSVEPECTVWDGLQYSVSSLCRVESYTAAVTNCFCHTSTPNVVGDDVGGADSGEHRELNEMSSSANMVVGGFIDTFTSAGTLSLASLTHNAVIFSVCVVIVCASLFGLILAIRMDRRELLARNLDLAEAAGGSAVKLFDDLIVSWRPEELSEIPWYIKLWRKIVAEHEWISVFSGYKSLKDYRTTKCMECVGLLINFLFIDTIMAVLFFFDDGTCESYAVQSQCLTQMSLDQQDTLCVWDGDACSFNPNIGQSFTSTLILTAIITGISIPFQLFFSSMVEAIRDYCCMKFIRNGDSRLPDLGLRMDIDAVQTRRGKFFRAARLLKMREIMDDVTVEAEAELLHAQIEHDMGRPVYELLGIQRSMPYSEGTRERRGSSLANEEIEAAKLRAARRDRWLVAVNEIAGKSLLSHHFTEIESVESLHKKLETAREREQQIVNLIENSDSVFVQNKILMQQFCANLLTGFRGTIARQLFTHSARESAADRTVGFYHYFSLFMFPCYVLGTCFYIFLFGIRLGSRSTNIWLLGGLISLAEEILLLAPMKVYLKRIAMSSIIVSDVKVVFQHLQRKAKLIMCRSNGLMKSANGMVHHLNPACRAARRYPGLTVSRLLISITDDDLPRNLAIPHSLSAISYLHLFSLVTVLCIASLPDVFQDVVFESSAVSGVGGLLIVLAELGKVSAAIPVVIVFVFLVCPTLYLLWTCCKRRKSTIHISTNPAFDVAPVIADTESPTKLDVGAPEAVASPAVVGVKWQNLLHDLDGPDDPVAMMEPAGSRLDADNFPRKKYKVSKEFNNPNKRKPDTNLFDYNDFLDYDAEANTLYANPLSPAGRYGNSEVVGAGVVLDEARGVKGHYSLLSNTAAVTSSYDDTVGTRLPRYDLARHSILASSKLTPNTSPVSLRTVSPKATPAKLTTRKKSASPIIRLAYRSPSRTVGLKEGSSRAPSSKSASSAAFVPLNPTSLPSSPPGTPSPTKVMANSLKSMSTTPIQHSMSFHEFIGVLDAAELGTVTSPPSSAASPLSSPYLTLNDMISLSPSKTQKMLIRISSADAIGAGLV
jgi:hypothetical protein